jgi:hypothetical protein
MQTGSGQVLSAVGQERKRAGERITGNTDVSGRNVRIPWVSHLSAVM